jgi:hypothetical protein
MNEIKFVEKYLGVKLHWYQKILLKIMINKPRYIYCSRGNQKPKESLKKCLRLKGLKN